MNETTPIRRSRRRLARRETRFTRRLAQAAGPRIEVAVLFDRLRAVVADLEVTDPPAATAAWRELSAYLVRSTQNLETAAARRSRRR